MVNRPHLVFMVGGAFHPAAEQARTVCTWLGDGYDCTILSGADAFDVLAEADLFVPMGTHFPGMAQPNMGGLPYRTPTPEQRTIFERYISTGKPLLVHHGSVLSFSDWPRFGRLLGFWWDWDLTKMAPVGEYIVHVKPTNHPVMAGVMDYVIEDELYIDVQLAPGLAPLVHAEAHIQDDNLLRYNSPTMFRTVPVVYTSDRSDTGTGRRVYFVNGHDLRAFTCDALRRMWINAVRWLLAESPGE